MSTRLTVDQCDHSWDRPAAAGCSACAFHNGPETGVAHFDIFAGELLLHVDTEDGCGTDSFVIWSAALEQADEPQALVGPQEKAEPIVDDEWGFLCTPVSGSSFGIYVNAATLADAAEAVAGLLFLRGVELARTPSIMRRPEPQTSTVGIGNRSSERVFLPSFRRNGSGGYVPVAV